MTGRSGMVAMLLLTTAAGAATAQDTAGQRGCRTALTATGRQAAGSNLCQTVAVIVVTERSASLFDALGSGEVPAADLQSTLSLAPSTAGSTAQGSAVPGVNTTAVAGATLAAVGSNGGSNAIAAIAINPAVFFIDPSVREQVARLTRLIDISFLVPVNGMDQDEDGDIDYFGARVRLNMNGLSNGSRLLEEAERIFGSIVEQDARMALRIRDALAAASEANAAACATALLSEDVTDEDAAAACDDAIELAFDDALHRQLATRLARAREEADSRYLGIDLRIDTGDPTLGEVTNASGTFLFAGIAAGRNYAFSDDGLTRSGFNARVGIRYATLSDTSATDFSVDGGFGFSWRRAMDSQHVIAGFGLEFRYSGEDEFEDELQTDFLMLRASLKVPVTTANAVSINFGQPLAGDVSQVLSVSFDLGLLFGRQ